MKSHHLEQKPLRGVNLINDGADVIAKVDNRQQGAMHSLARHQGVNTHIYTSMMLFLMMVLLIGGAVCGAQSADESTTTPNNHTEPFYLANAPERQCPGVSRNCGDGRVFDVRACRCRITIGEITLIKKTLITNRIHF